MTHCRWQAAIFDLDGTILDSMPIWNNLGTAFLQAKGIAPEPDVTQALSVMSLSQAAEYLRRHYALSETPEKLVDQISDFIAGFYRTSIPPKPGVRTVLQQLRARGLPLAVATATERELAVAALKRLSLLPYFSHILSCSRESQGKQSPQVYLRAADLLGAPPACTLVFEDAPHAVMTAVQAGFPVIAIADESAREQQKQIQQAALAYLSCWDEFSPTLL